MESTSKTPKNWTNVRLPSDFVEYMKTRMEWGDAYYNFLEKEVGYQRSDSQ